MVGDKIYCHSGPSDQSCAALEAYMFWVWRYCHCRYCANRISTGSSVRFGILTFVTTAPRAGGCRVFILSRSWLTPKLSAFKRNVGGHGKPSAAPLAVWDEVEAVRLVCEVWLQSNKRNCVWRFGSISGKRCIIPWFVHVMWRISDLDFCPRVNIAPEYCRIVDQITLSRIKSVGKINKIYLYRSSIC
jgi:hypothetical protein